MNILLIDDEEKIIELLCESLVNDGHHVECQSDPKQALKDFLEAPSKFDLIVTDHLMPSLLGTELIQNIRKVHPQFPIILATGTSAQELEQELNKLKIRNVKILQKPYRKTTLMSCVDELLSAL